MLFNTTQAVMDYVTAHRTASLDKPTNEELLKVALYDYALSIETYAEESSDYYIDGYFPLLAAAHHYMQIRKKCHDML